MSSECCSRPIPVLPNNTTSPWARLSTWPKDRPNINVVFWTIDSLCPIWWWPGICHVPGRERAKDRKDSYYTVLRQQAYIYTTSPHHHSATTGTTSPPPLPRPQQKRRAAIRNWPTRRALCLSSLRQLCWWLRRESLIWWISHDWPGWGEMPPFRGTAETCLPGGVAASVQAGVITCNSSASLPPPAASSSLPPPPARTATAPAAEASAPSWHTGATGYTDKLWARYPTAADALEQAMYFLNLYLAEEWGRQSSEGTMRRSAIWISYSICGYTYEDATDGWETPVLPFDVDTPQIGTQKRYLIPLWPH